MKKYNCPETKKKFTILYGLTGSLGVALKKLERDRSVLAEVKNLKEEIVSQKASLEQEFAYFRAVFRVERDIPPEMKELILKQISELEKQFPAQSWGDHAVCTKILFPEEMEKIQLPFLDILNEFKWKKTAHQSSYVVELAAQLNFLFPDLGKEAIKQKDVMEKVKSVAEGAERLLNFGSTDDLQYCKNLAHAKMIYPERVGNPNKFVAERIKNTLKNKTITEKWIISAAYLKILLGKEGSEMFMNIENWKIAKERLEEYRRYVENCQKDTPHLLKTGGYIERYTEFASFLKILSADRVIFTKKGEMRLID